MKHYINKEAVKKIGKTVGVIIGVGAALTLGVFSGTMIGVSGNTLKFLEAAEHCSNCDANELIKEYVKLTK